MFNYVLRRLILLPITLFCILLVNFVIINLAPGEPVTVTDISDKGEAARRADQGVTSLDVDQYLQFREHFGLTLPILWNGWPWITREQVADTLREMATRRAHADDTEEMSVKDYNADRVRMGDQARFVMPLLLSLARDPALEAQQRIWAVRFFVRGGTRQGVVGINLTPAQRAYNRKISFDNELLRSSTIDPSDNAAKISEKINRLAIWYEKNKVVHTGWSQMKILFLETRFCRYMERVCTLDFGTLRTDTSKTVIHEVVRRFKYSLTLSIIPMIATFVLCQFFGFAMALYQRRWPDYLLSISFLILYAIPVFVVAPFLIENVALHHHFPFTDIFIPSGGFTSKDSVYETLTSNQRVVDVATHIFLPLIAIMYGTLAVQSRLSRTAILEVLRQDYVRTARAKGVPLGSILFWHVGRNAGITIITSLAASLGVILGGSLIVETLFDINGFGKFFYDAVVNRDYNVIMFSVLAGSVLTLIGYLAADVTYTVLDPRVTLD